MLHIVIMSVQVHPLFYMESITDEQIAEYECSDRIWLPRGLFESWVTSSDPGVATLLKLTNGVGQSVIGAVYSIHHNMTDIDTIYIPSWMYKEIDCDTCVTLTRVTPSLCSGLVIQPHTSDHLSVADPQELLRNAFERYSCLTPGHILPVWIGHAFTVTIASLKPRNDETLCILNCEVELELMPPLDLPIPPPPTTKEEDDAAAAAAVAAQDTIQHVQSPGYALGGATPSNKSLKELVAEAARKRLKEQKESL